MAATARALRVRNPGFAGQALNFCWFSVSCLCRGRGCALNSRLQSTVILPQMLANHGKQVSGTMTDTSSVIHEKRGQAFWITINRPDKRNAINADVVAGIVRGYREAHDDKDVRVIVLTGAGDKAFCAGADLQNSGAAFAMDFSRPECRLRRSAAAVAECHQARDCAGRGRLHGRRHGAVVHDRHGGRRRSRDFRSARGEGRRVPDAGAEPAAVDRAEAARQRMVADRRAVRRARPRRRPGF